MISPEQANKWTEIIELCRRRFRHDLALLDPDVWFGVHLRDYLRLLYDGLGGAVSPQLSRNAVLERRASLGAFRIYLGREPTPDDLLTELTGFAEVPEFVAEAIRHDFRQLQRRS